MVVLAILLILAGVMVGGLHQITVVEHRAAAVKLVNLFGFLRDEAQMQDRTFRIRFDLNGDQYSVEQGDPTALIFNDPEQKAAWEREQAAKLKMMDEKEKADYLARQQPFDKVSDFVVKTTDLPSGMHVGGVYTPQYGKMIVPLHKEDTPEEPQVVYIYLFPNGVTERSVVWLTEGEGSTGWTIQVEPMSGNAHLEDGLLDWEKSFEWMPTAGPELPL
jgi:hypothetical protein